MGLVILLNLFHHFLHLVLVNQVIHLLLVVQVHHVDLPLQVGQIIQMVQAVLMVHVHHLHLMVLVILVDLSHPVVQGNLRVLLNHLVHFLLGDHQVLLILINKIRFRLSNV